MVYFAYKINEQRVRQQDAFAASGDKTHFRHREVRWEGLIMISKQTMTDFWGKKWDKSATSPLHQPVVHLRFEIWTPTSFLVYTDNIYVYIWKDRQKYWVRIEIDLKFIHTDLYQNDP